MPGLMVCEPLESLTDATVPLGLGPASEASGSFTDTPDAGEGLMVAMPAFWTPPATSMIEAVSWALPLAEIAVVELESTTTAPGILMLAVPERVSAPLADRSSTKTDGATETVKDRTKLHAVTPLAIGSAAVIVTVYVP